MRGCQEMPVRKFKKVTSGRAKKCTAVFTSTTTMPIVVKIETAAQIQKRLKPSRPAPLPRQIDVAPANRCERAELRRTGGYLLCIATLLIVAGKTRRMEQAATSPIALTFTKHRRRFSRRDGLRLTAANQAARAPSSASSLAGKYPTRSLPR